MTDGHTVLELEEYKSVTLPSSELREDHGQYIYSEYSDKIEVAPPSFATGGCWELRPRGWVGYLPVAPDFGVALTPRVPIRNLFRMLEYAYRLKSFRFLEGAIESSSLEDFYERLANVLAKRILDRARRGLYRSYIPESNDLPYVRGQMDVRRTIQTPWEIIRHAHL